MEQVLLTYGFLKEIVATKMMHYKDTKAMVCLPDDDTDWFGLVWFYGISTIVGYLMPNPVFTYVLNIYNL